MFYSKIKYLWHPNFQKLSMSNTNDVIHLIKLLHDWRFTSDIAIISNNFGNLPICIPPARTKK